MQRVRKAGAIVLNSDGDILVVTNRLGGRTLPKGTIGAEETAEEAARREIYEEAGISDLTIHRWLGILSRPGYSDENWQVMTIMKDIDIFFATTEQKHLEPVEEDIVRAEWFPAEKLPEILTHTTELQFYEQHAHELAP